MSDCRSRDQEVDPGIPSYTFVEIGHEMISTAYLLPSADSRRVVIIFKRNFVFNRLVKFAQVKKVWLHVGELIVPDIAI